MRELEPERTIIIGSNRWQNFATVKDLRLPKNDRNIIISFHYYEPFLLTHYRASWTDLKDIAVTVHYPGLIVDKSDSDELAKVGRKNETYNIQVIETHFNQVLAAAAKYGLKVYCGEYGCIHNAPQADKIRWYEDLNTLFNRYGIARANWDYKGSFGIVRDKRIQEEMIRAILKKPL